MASRGWGKNKKGILVNSEGKTSLEVRLDKYASKLKARKEKLAAKKAEAKAKASGGGGGASTSPSASGGEGEFTQKTVSILNREGKARKVKGEVLGDYVISAGGNDAYSIHHVPTGLEITSSVGFKTRNPAKYESLSEKEAARLAVRKLVDAKIDIPDSYSKWDKSSTDKKAKIGQAIVDAFDDKKTPAKPASKGSEEKSATQKTKKPSDMSAREMQKEYQQIDDKQAKLTDKLIEAGFSRVTMSEISRRRNENPLFKEYAELSDRAKELTLEAEIRGGPGFRVRDLTSKHTNPYAKKPNKKISNRGD